MRTQKLYQKKKLLEIVNSFGKAYKICTQKSVAFLFTNNEQREKENNPIYNSLIKNKVPWNKFNERNQDSFNENYKPLKREIEEDIRRWKDLLCL
jgi:hypothetical protein